MIDIIKKYNFFPVICAIIVALIVISSDGLSQDKEMKYTEQQYRNALNMLDGQRPDPQTDPDIDMFISNWKKSTPKTEYGGLLIRDILTSLEGDPLRPARQGAVLQFINPLSYTKLQKRSLTNRFTLKDEQLYLYIDNGTGIIEGADKKYDLYSGVGVLISQGMEFSIRGNISWGSEFIFLNDGLDFDIVSVKGDLIADDVLTCAMKL